MISIPGRHFILFYWNSFRQKYYYFTWTFEISKIVKEWDEQDREAGNGEEEEKKKEDEEEEEEEEEKQQQQQKEAEEQEEQQQQQEQQE